MTADKDHARKMAHLIFEYVQQVKTWPEETEYQKNRKKEILGSAVPMLKYWNDFLKGSPLRIEVAIHYDGELTNEEKKLLTMRVRQQLVASLENYSIETKQI